jgi:hypothetical protein
MTQARQAVRSFPVAVIYLAAAVIAAIVLSAMLVTGAPSLFSTQAPSSELAPVNPALIEAGHEWERRHRLLTGDVDPLVRAGQEWEHQRHLQSIAFE